MQNETYYSSAISQLNSWILMNEWMNEWTNAVKTQGLISSILFNCPKNHSSKASISDCPSTLHSARYLIYERTFSILDRSTIICNGHSFKCSLYEWWVESRCFGGQHGLKWVKTTEKCRLIFYCHVCVWWPREESCSFLFPFSHDIWLMFSSTNSSQAPQAPGTSTSTARTSPVLDLSCSHQEADFTPRRHSRSADNSWLSSNPSFGNWHTPNGDSRENGKYCHLPLMFLYVPIESRYVWRGP